MFMIRKFVGMLESAKDGNGIPYYDWRKELIGQHGLAMVLQSERLYPGKAFVFNYGWEADEDDETDFYTNFFNTTYDTLEEDEDRIRIRTKNLECMFRKGRPHGTEINPDGLMRCVIITGKAYEDLFHGYDDERGGAADDVAEFLDITF